MHAPFVEEGACFPAQGNLGVATRSYSSEGVCFLPKGVAARSTDGRDKPDNAREGHLNISESLIAKR